MRFKEFCQLVGIPEREIRYLMSLDIIPPASARGRYADGFGDMHVAAARRYAAFAATGLGAREIAGLPPDARAPEVVLSRGGLELRILPQAMQRDLDEEAVRAFLQQAEVALNGRRFALSPHAPASPTRKEKR